jgi:ATPase family associated with various cellular activities (AAA)
VLVAAMTAIASLFDEALRHPSPGYALGKRLAELFPDRALVEGTQSLFQPRAFERDGHCTITPRTDLYNQYDVYWNNHSGTHVSARCEWSTVMWRDKAFDVVWLTTFSGFSELARFYVLAQTRDDALAFVDAVCRWNHEVRGEILVYNGGCFSKDKKLFAAVQAASFDDLVLDGTLKQQIRDDFAQFLGARAAYETHGVPWKRGALLLGPPGNGKTLCVKAIVRELAVPCIYVQSFENRQSTVQGCIEQVFTRARATAPCVIVLEDIDALLVPGSHSFFLNELDGFASNAGVITLATTNHAERLDPSIVDRPSRFDRKYHFELPGESTRREYSAMWNARLEQALRMRSEEIDELAGATAGFSFAYIQEVFVSAMMRWMASREPGGLAVAAREQVALLREQMTTTPTPARR